MGFYVVGSFANLGVASKICEGCLIADIPAIICSIDIVMGEIDR
jgi:NADH-quinone oxidoreductase subunit D